MTAITEQPKRPRYDGRIKTNKDNEMSIDKHYARQAAQHQAAIDRADKREDYIAHKANERLDNITSDELVDLIADLTAEQFDRIMARAVQRDVELKMIAFDRFYAELDGDVE